MSSDWTTDWLRNAHAYLRYAQRCRAILKRTGVPEQFIGDDLETIVEQAGLADREFEEAADFEAALRAWGLNIAREIAGGRLDATNVAPKADGQVEPTWLSARDLAERHGLTGKLNALEKRLARWRKQNGDGWTDVPEVGRQSRGPRFLYNPSAVREVIDAMLARS